MSPPVQATIAATESSDTATITAKSRTGLSLDHLFAACRFTARIAEVERQNEGQPLGPFWSEVLHNALGVATLSVASLESYANELYFEGAAIMPPLNPAAAAEIADLIDNENILRKYATALAIRTGRSLDFGIAPVQNADALIKLRNAVVHFRPEWSDEQERHDKLSKILRYRFKPSPWLPAEALFPRAWASHDFARWALQATVGFLEHFYAEAGINSPLAQFKRQLTELSGAAL